MNIEELCKVLEIPQDKVEEAKKSINSYLDGNFVPKSRFNEVNEEKNGLKKTVEERDKQLETLKKSTSDIDSFKIKIKELQEANKKAKEESEKALYDLKVSDAIKLEIAGSAQDVDIVSSLVDKSKIVMDKDGKITGLTEQIDALRKDKAFLFKDAKMPAYKPDNGNGGNVNNPFAKETFNLTAQGKMLRENPEQARAMATAAGIKI